MHVSAKGSGVPFTLTRSLLVIILPGLVAILPWALWLASKIERLDHLYQTYGVLANALLVGLAILIGSIAESSLTNLEVKWDREREETYQVKENWYAYLALQPSRELVGFRYISRLVTTLYFELSMMVASPLALSGLAVLFADYTYRLGWLAVVALLLLAIGSIVFFYGVDAGERKLVAESCANQIGDKNSCGKQLAADPKPSSADYDLALRLCIEKGVHSDLCTGKRKYK